MKLRKIILPVLVLGTAVAVATTVVATRPQVAQEPREELGTLVEVAEVWRQQVRIDVQAQGTVIPARRVVVQPQLSGRIVEVPNRLSPGTILRTGELLFAILASKCSRSIIGSCQEPC